MAQGRFPKAYVNDAKIDPIMEYVTFPNTGIGSRPSGTPKGDAARSQGLSLDHVGGTAGGSK